MARLSDAADRRITGYGVPSAPSWLTSTRSAERRRPLDVSAHSVKATIAVTLWSLDSIPDDTPLPMLLVHDGPQYDTRAGLTAYLGAGIASGLLPAVRVALLNPGIHRNRWYSANSRYTTAVRNAVIPALARTVATTTRTGMGTSLGALAILAIQRRDPSVFDAMFLQSGSFFQRRFDAHERRFPYYQRIERFVADVLSTGSARPVRTVLTCSAAEENIHNNRVMTEALRTHGYDATLYETTGDHDWPAWRDAFHPYLTALLSAPSLERPGR